MPDIRHPIKVVAQRTGLKAHVIRAWERRYGVVQPLRSEGNQRLYSVDDIEKLLLLRQITEYGHNIGNLAALPTTRLRRLLDEESVAVPLATAVSLTIEHQATGSPGNIATAGGTVSGRDRLEACLGQALAAAARLDGESLAQILDDALVDLGQMLLLQCVVQPLVERLGDLWSTGDLRVGHEHIATAVVRTFLGRIARPSAYHPSAPVIVCTTPAGQLHELGSLLVAAVANAHGWRAAYAGASLPAEEITAIARQLGARAVALSIVHPSDDPLLPAEFVSLRRSLPEEVAILAGGRGAKGYAQGLEAIHALVCHDLPGLAECLAALRQSIG